MKQNFSNFPFVSSEKALKIGTIVIYYLSTSFIVPGKKDVICQNQGGNVRKTIYSKNYDVTSISTEFISYQDML